jgi:curli production assembly/transport component CsgF
MDMKACALALGVVTVLAAPVSNAQELVYTPVNPSFGGSSFNSSHLLSIAEIDRPDPPSSGGGAGLGRNGTTQTDFFVRQLESRILSQLSRDITDAIFGADAEPSGTFSFNQTQLSFETLLDGTIQVEITDLVSGSTTLIEVPAFLTATN